MPFITVSSTHDLSHDWPDAAQDIATVISQCLSAPMGDVQVMVQPPLASVHGRSTYVEVKCRKKPDRPTEKLCDTASRIKAAVTGKLGMNGSGDDCIVRIYAFDDAVIGAD